MNRRNDTRDVRNRSCASLHGSGRTASRHNHYERPRAVKHFQTVEKHREKFSHYPSRAEVSTRRKTSSPSKNLCTCPGCGLMISISDTALISPSIARFRFQAREMRRPRATTTPPSAAIANRELRTTFPSLWLKRPTVNVRARTPTNQAIGTQQGRYSEPATLPYAAIRKMA
jgi:hypothetical protein